MSTSNLVFRLLCVACMFLQPSATQQPDQSDCRVQRASDHYNVLYRLRGWGDQFCDDSFVNLIEEECLKQDIVLSSITGEERLPWVPRFRYHQIGPIKGVCELNWRVAGRAPDGKVDILPSQNSEDALRCISGILDCYQNLSRPGKCVCYPSPSPGRIAVLNSYHDRPR